MDLLLLGTLVFGIAALYLFLSPLVAEPLYRTLLFKPQKSPNDDWRSSANWAGLQCEEVVFESPDSHKLHGWHFTFPHATCTVMVNHGNSGNIADLHALARLLARSGANIFLYDYRGFGKSESNPSVEGICTDVIAAYDWLTTVGRVHPESLFVYGESLGAAVSCFLAKQRSIAGLILQSGFTNIRQISYEQFPLLRIFPSALYPKPYFDNAKVLSETNVPVLLLHGSKDQEVNVEHAKLLYRACKGEKRLVILPNTAHEEICESDAEDFVAAILAFLPSKKPLHVADRYQMTSEAELSCPSQSLLAIQSAKS